MPDYKSFIEINPNVRFGKPCIKGTRISVYDVLGWLANGMKSEEIVAEYPELNEDQINACLAYAADKEHRIRVV
ncbi:DUF433 domain-containing protein [Flavihumibacter sp. R14]|nr:DUF433 domain-containing protein [Flavihumibacter soli]